MPDPSMPQGWLRRLLLLTTSRPYLVLATALLLCGLALIPASRLELGGNVYDLFPRGGGAAADLAAYSRAFGGQQDLVALVTGRDPAQVERATRQAAAELSRSPLIEEVRYGAAAAELAEGLLPRLFLLAGQEAWPAIRERLTSGLERQVSALRRLLLSPVTPNRTLLVADPLLLSELLLQQLEGGVSRTTGLYSSPSGRAALIFARPRKPASDLSFCHELQAALSRIEPALAEPGVRLQFTGGHLYAHYLAVELQHDLSLSTVVALVGLALVQLLFFRSFRLILFSVALGSVAVLWTLAAARVTVGQLNALSLSFAAICLGMGEDALIHVTCHTRSHLDEPPASRFSRAIAELFPAMSVAALTTVAAFASFSLSSFAGLSQTGWLAACGLLLNLLLMLTVFPAGATLLPPRPGPVGGLLDRGLARLARAVPRHRVAVLLVALLLGAGALLGLRGLPFSEDLARLAPPSLPPAATDQAIAQEFERNRHRLVVLVRGTDLEQLLRANDRLTEQLEAMQRRGELAGYVSLARLLPSQATQEERRRRLLALHPEEIARRLRKALEAEGLRSELFAPFFAALTAPRTFGPEQLPPGLQPLVAHHLSRDGADRLISAVVYPRAGAEWPAVARTLEQLSSPRARVTVTGAALAGAQVAKLLERDLFYTSAATLAAVVLMLCWVLRRPFAIAAAGLSLLLSGALFVGCLRLLGIQLDLYNLMVIPLLIGYGVDNHLYVVHRTLGSGLREGVESSGRSVLASCLTTMAAFGALCFCRLPGLQTLGLTASIGLGLSLLSSLVVMPALLALSPTYRPSPPAAQQERPRGR